GFLAARGSARKAPAQYALMDLIGICRVRYQRCRRSALQSAAGPLVRPFAFQAACLCLGSEASRLRSASTDSEISPRRQISGVVIWPCALGIGCWRTFACGIDSSTDSGISAIPAPAVTQATMA